MEKYPGDGLTELGVDGSASDPLMLLTLHKAYLDLTEDDPMDGYDEDIIGEEEEEYGYKD